MRIRYTFVFWVLCICLSSCAYYNTFYNTKKFFNEAKKEREKRKGDRASSQELQKLDKTIEKASKILEIYPNSKYVDDAVMILGECFYYKRDYIKAQTKFQELRRYFPNSQYFQQANVWLAKIDIKLYDYIGAEHKLKKLRESPKIKKDIHLESTLLWGDLLFQQANFEAAEEKYKIVATTAKNKDYRAHAYLQLGQSQLQIGKYSKAIGSFQNAIKYSPDEKFEFEAEQKYGIALKLAGDYDSSIKVCSGLLENITFKHQHGVVKLEIADCKYRAGKSLLKQLKETDSKYHDKIYEAIEEYEKITIEHKRTEASASAYFQMGRIYEDVFDDFTEAKENYDKVRIEYGRSQLVGEANKKSKDLGELIKIRNAIQKAEGRDFNVGSQETHQMTEMEMLLLEHGVHPELRFLRKKRKLAKLEQASEATSESQSTSSTNESLQTNVNEIVNNKLRLAEIYLFQLVRIDSALKQYQEILERYPDHPDGAKALYSVAYIYENEFLNKAVTDSLLYYLVGYFPDSYQAQEARKKLGLRIIEMQSDQVADLYKFAEHTLFNKNDIQGAINSYQQIIEKYPESEYTPKALYAVGWIYEQIMFENDKAFEYYQEVVNKYPNTEISKNLKKKIEAVKKESEINKKTSSNIATSDSLEMTSPTSEKKSTEQILEDEKGKKPVGKGLEQDKRILEKEAKGQKPANDTKKLKSDKLKEDKNKKPEP